MDRTPETRFATSDELSIAYQVVGDGPIDLVFVPGFMSHVELNWDYVFMGTALDRLAEISRLVVLDKRGTGLSDRSLGTGTLEDRMNDIRAVMDAEGIGRASIVGVSNGGPLAATFGLCAAALNASWTSSRPTLSATAIVACSTRPREAASSVIDSAENGGV